MNGPRDFRSVLAERMRDFLAYHRALGKRFKSEEDGLRLLDRYLLRQPVTTPEAITPALLETYLPSATMRGSASWWGSRCSSTAIARRHIPTCAERNKLLRLVGSSAFV